MARPVHDDTLGPEFTRMIGWLSDRFAVSRTTAALALGVGAAGLWTSRRRQLIPVLDSTPAKDGFRMPAEFEPLEAVWLIWPEGRLWREGGAPAQEIVTRLANALAEDLPVRLGVSARQATRARSKVSRAVEVVEMPGGTGWVRDDGPTLLVDESGVRRGVDWDFNLWGYGGMTRFTKGFSSLRTNRALETAQRILGFEEAGCYRAPFVLEGGSIHSDGAGTVLTTEECLLNPNRNPGLSRGDLDRHLKAYLGAEKVIWLPRGVFKDGTSGHVDNLCCFVRPAEVLLTWTDDAGDEQYERSREALEILERSTDALGRSLRVHKLHQPGPLHATESEWDSMPPGSKAEFEWSGGRLAGSYVNFILTNRRVVFPLLDPANDERAHATLAGVFPDREVVGIESREILLHGGNLHCISQQVPAGVAGKRALDDASAWRGSQKSAPRGSGQAW